MNQTFVMYGLLAVVAYFMGKEIYAALKKRVASRRATEQTVIDLIIGLGTVVKTLATDTGDSSKIMSGTMKACEAIALSVDSLRLTVAELKAALALPVTSAPPTEAHQYPPDAMLMPQTDSESRFQGDVFAAMIEHRISETDAQQRVLAEEEKKSAISAVEME